MADSRGRNTNAGRKNRAGEVSSYGTISNRIGFETAREKINLTTANQQIESSQRYLILDRILSLL